MSRPFREAKSIALSKVSVRESLRQNLIDSSEEEDCILDDDEVESVANGSDENDSSAEEDNVLHEMQSHSNSPMYIDNKDWVSVRPNTDQYRSLTAFSGNHGLRIQVPASGNDFVLEMLDNELLGSLVDWSNKKAATNPDLRNKYKGDKRIHERQWQDITIEEMRKFVAMVLLMGIVKKPELQDYFSTNFVNETPFFCRKDTLSRDRFLQILRYLRFYDISTHAEGNPKLSKVQAGIDIMIKKAKSVYTPGKQLSADEFLMLYKGRLKMKQYIKNKRARFGVKCFSLNARNGFTYDIEVYQGQETPVGDWASNVDNADCLSMSEKIVVELLNRNNFLNEGRQITVDNWFCSVRLANFLANNQTGVLGTIRTNRGVPNELVNFKMKPVDSEFARNGCILITKFVDKRDVYVLSTFHTVAFVEKTKTIRGGQDVTYYKPKIIEDYNCTMDGTDKVDAMQHSVICVRKSYVWHKKLGLHLLQRLCLVNAYILAREYIPTATPRSLSRFTLPVIEKLMFMGTLPNPSVAKVNTHYAENIPGTETRPRPSKCCQMCWKRAPPGTKRVSETSFRCAVCPSHPALHTQCFGPWHNGDQ